MSQLLGTIPSFSQLRGKPNDDWIDRMSHVYTTVILIIFTVAVSSGQFFKDPIQCWHPAEFKGSMEAYTTYNCWVKNTYYVPMYDEIPPDITTRQDAELTYYQWVPLILLFMALLFKLPNVVWRIFSGGSGLNLDKIVGLAEQSQLGSPDNRKETIKCIAVFIDKWLEATKETNWSVLNRTKQQCSRYLFCFCNKKAGRYLVTLYLFVKVLYALNAIGQLFLLNAFLATRFNFYGFEFLENLYSKNPWKESPRFPRVTLCDFQIRLLQNELRYTVQCVLPINLFNEKIFIFVWFWLIFIASLAVFNLFVWVYIAVLKAVKIQYCKKYLKINNELHTSFDKKLCIKFAEYYMRDDGVFMLRLVAKNSTEMVVSDLVKELWMMYKNKQNTRKNDDAKELIPEVKENLAQ